MFTSRNVLHILSHLAPNGPPKWFGCSYFVSQYLLICWVWFNYSDSHPQVTGDLWLHYISHLRNCISPIYFTASVVLVPIIHTHRWIEANFLLLFAPKQSGKTFVDFLPAYYIVVSLEWERFSASNPHPQVNCRCSRWFYCSSHRSKSPCKLLSALSTIFSPLLSYWTQNFPNYDNLPHIVQILLVWLH